MKLVHMFFREWVAYRRGGSSLLTAGVDSKYSNIGFPRHAWHVPTRSAAYRSSRQGISPVHAPAVFFFAWRLAACVQGAGHGFLTNDGCTAGSS